ncbi:hypothetical protein [Nitrosopumilus ureiphilus]|uniref:Type IV pilin n=1 Tax=Nitrosopumilus ureiphilus TaxID=1470067 RepID=A0A7D5MAX5_9ARCH|nr:hypothetical protein [Nitrosopumilus ureiphilus]QLH07289.1 hypothetical protein C5F50_09535 [Nitrosopumilus ureiphilus]
MNFKKRRAVGGLISLIGIIIVFGIVSVAYLELSSAQTNLISTSLVANQKVSDKNNARLNFTSTPTLTDGQYVLPIDNIGSDTISIQSYIVYNSTHNIIGKGEKNSSINAGNNISFVTDAIDITNSDSDIILIVTDLGKKCVIPADVSFRIC